MKLIKYIVKLFKRKEFLDYPLESRLIASSVVHTTKYKKFRGRDYDKC